MLDLSERFEGYEMNKYMSEQSQEDMEARVNKNTLELRDHNNEVSSCQSMGMQS